MSGFDFKSAGESHGPQLTGIIEGLPSGLAIDFDRLAALMAARQEGFGRGGRMKIEKDECRITAGVRHGLTLGSPLAFVIANRDWVNWQSVMSITAERPAPGSERETALDAPRTLPRPGHADLAGAQKWNFSDLRNVLERASARETATRVAAGALAQMLLSEFGVTMAAHVVRIGRAALEPGERSVEAIREQTNGSDVRCCDPETGDAMRSEIRAAAASSDTIGGVVEIVVTGVVPGLGDHTQWNRKLDGRLAQAVMSVPSIKGFEIGAGFAQAAAPGSQVHDAIYYSADHEKGHTGYYRKTNRAGGLEGGLTNGADLIVRAAAKPISTLNAPLDSADIHTKEQAKAFVERSDICCVPAAAVVCEAMVAITLADAYLRLFGEGALSDLKIRFEAYGARLDHFSG
jgi:chorismate synthase